MFVDGGPVSSVHVVRDLGIRIDSDLSMWTLVSYVRRSVPVASFQTLTVTLVNQRLDCGNSTLVGIPAYLNLQSVLNAATRLIFHTRRSVRSHHGLTSTGCTFQIEYSTRSPCCYDSWTACSAIQGSPWQCTSVPKAAHSCH